MKWFRRGPSPHHTALAMVGAKAGDRVLIAGANDPGLAAEIALVTGLNGQTLVIGAPDIRPAVEAAAANAGALVEVAGEVPRAGEEPFDVAVWIGDFASLAADQQRLVLRQLHDALRAGGRAIVADRPVTKGGLFSAARPSPTPATLALLASTGWVAVRSLASVGSVTYYEARKPR